MPRALPHRPQAGVSLTATYVMVRPSGIGGRESVDAAVRQRNLALLAEGEALVENAAAAGLAVRLLGGVAVMHHCPQVRASGGSRTIADLDLMASSGQSRKLSAYLVGRGYQAEARFNALHGQDRMLFHGPLGQLDVLVGTFEMCHRLEMDGRLILETPTLSATDLLLTKLQIVEINHKDVVDAIDLLDAHELGSTEGDVINLTYLGEVTARDWGLWRTIKGTLDRLEQEPLASPTAEKIAEVKNAIENSPKSLKWKARARIGDRRRWFNLPDEVT